MTHRDKLPVEPLSRAAWQRVREETFAELDAGIEAGRSRAPRRRGVRAVAATLVAALAAAAVFLIAAGRQASVVPGPTSRIEATADFTRTSVGDVALEVSPGTVLVTTGGDAAGWTVLLEKGRASFSVPKRGDRAAFRVQAAAALVEVVGTRFTVSRNGEHVRVSVAEGTVRVTNDGQVKAVVAGHHWENAAPTTDASETTGTAVPPSTIETPPEAASSRKAEPTRTPPRAASASAVPEREGESKPAPATRVVPSLRERYETATKLEATDPSAALAIYSELSRGEGPWAANALYAAGRLELELGRKNRAKQLLEQYERRFPKGQNSEEARKLLERLR